MSDRTDRKVKAILAGRRRQAGYMALVFCLAMVVTVGVAGALHLNAKAKTYQTTVLTCTAEPQSGPGYADFFVHVHNDDCYDENGWLVCPLPEIQEHVHDEGCYSTTTELVCDIPESDGHHHDES